MKTSMNNRIAAARSRAFARGGFTLIELMAVIVIVAILAALTVSVGMYLRQDSSRKLTVAAIEVLSSALAAYQDETGTVPSETCPNDKWIVPPLVLTPYNTSEIAQATARSMNLYSQLTTVKSSNDRLASLPKEVCDQTNKLFLDGFERPIDYRETGGMGGAPLLISAGADGMFGYPHTIAVNDGGIKARDYPGNTTEEAAYANAQKDNIQK